MAAVRLMESELQSREWHDIQGLLQRAYRRVRLSKVEGEILASRGLSLDSFLNEGAKLLPASTYANVDTRMSLYDLDAALIVAGFGSDDLPAVMTVRNPGIVTDHTKLGFWCIGSGSTLAQTSMFSRDYSWTFPVEQAAYLVYEAKRNSERAPGAGYKESDIAVLTKNGVGRVLPDVLKHFEAIYQELKPREFTPGHATQLMALSAFRQIRASL